MLRKKRETGSGRTRKIGATFWLVALLVAITAPSVLEAQERDRSRFRGGPDGALMRFRGTLASRAMLGIQLSTRPADADAQGAEVRGVTNNGPADEAGLQEGDIITTLGGNSLLEPLADSDLEERVDPDRSVPSQRLLLMARELEPGEEVVVAYLRDGEEASATLEARANRGWAMLGFDADEMEEMMEQVRERTREVRDRSEEMREQTRELTEEMREQWDDYAWFPEAGSAIAVAIEVMGLRASHGISLVTLNAELGRYFNAESGALVTEADEDNPLGLEAGDVILAIDGRTIDSAGDMRRILRSYEEGEAVTLRIMRDRSEREVSGSVEDQARARRGVVRGAPFGPAGRRITSARRGPGRVAVWRAPNRGRQPWRSVRR